MPAERSVLFYRDFRRFSGGHLKVWHYFKHVANSERFRPEVVFSDESLWDATNPWSGLEVHRAAELGSLRPDVLFVGGMDWEALASFRAGFGAVPVINLVQHVNHADPANPRYRFLGERALRICVSEEIRAALAATGRVNGPLYCIPNGIDAADLPRPAAAGTRDIDLLVDGIKSPPLAAQLLPQLQATGLRVQALTTRIPRTEYLGRLNRARMTLFLPRAREGFYLPALEGMALGTLVICPDCEGNRSFCLPGVNCLRPDYSIEALVAAVETAQHMPPPQRTAMQEQGRMTVAKHGLMAERRAFLEILEGI